MASETYVTFSAVVPAYNENQRFNRVVEELLKIKQLNDLVFVDDGSTDGTSVAAKKYQADPRFHYIRHTKNKGKGAALQTGVKNAQNEVILFLDADLANITAEKILRIVKPVLNGEVDVSRGAFTRKSGRVTEYAVKPMMQILFPGLYFEQPISGQICAKKGFLSSLDYGHRYSVDIGILFDAIDSGQRIKEVDIGKLEHKANNDEVIGEMSRQVLEAMIERAGLIRHKYKLVIFTLDHTLIRERDFKAVFTALGINDQAVTNYKLYENGQITAAQYLEANARLFAGLESAKIEELSQAIPFAKYAPEVITSLKRRRYKVGIITSNLSPIVDVLAKRLGVDVYNCVELEKKKGVLTGNIKASSRQWLTPSFDESFKKAFLKLTRRARSKPAETIFVAGNPRAIPMLSLAGLSVAYKPKGTDLKQAADKTISLHAELLAIIE